VNEQVILVSIPKGRGGKGYTSPPTVRISGGGGSGAIFQVDPEKNMTPITYSNVNGYLRCTGGSLQGTLTLINSGSGYTSTPSVTFVGGKGTTASVNKNTDVTLTPDGKITQLQIISAGTGYSTETDAQASDVSQQQIVIDHPSVGGGNPSGTRATAKVTQVGASGEITGIQMVNCGSGYIGIPGVSFVRGGSGATAVATFKEDGRLYDTTIVTAGTKYTRRPTVSNVTNRPADDGGGGITPGSGASVVVFLEGRATGEQSIYKYNWIPDGYQKFVGAYVFGTAIYTLPFWTNRALSINALTNEMSDLSLNFGRGYGLYTTGVATRDSSRFYGVPYNSRRIVKITGATGSAEYIGPSVRGRWNDGVAAYNNNIYCMPAYSNTLLVIDTKSEPKSELITFTNIRGRARNKWWSAVLSGTTAGDAMIYGIPGDLDQVLELNPGIPLRSKSLPAMGTVVNGSTIVYPPTSKNRQVGVYDAVSKTMTYHAIPSGSNSTFADIVQIDSGNVVFVPTYNQTDDFVYEGKLGVFNVVTNTFTFTTTTVPIDLVPLYPSRSCVRLGTSVGSGQLIAWPPRETSNAIVTYDHVAGEVSTSDAQRESDKVDFVSAQIVGPSTTASKVIVSLPKSTSEQTYAVGYTGFGDHRFSGSVLVGDRIFLIPGYGVLDIHIFYPSDPLADPSKTVEDIAFKTTLIPLPTAIREEHERLLSTRFQGGVLADNKVWCIPYTRDTVMVIDTVSYTVSEISSDALTALMDTVTGLFWGAVVAGDGRIFCVPYNSPYVMIVDPKEPIDKISFIQTTNLGLGGSKWRNGVLAQDGKIYCAAFNATSVLIIDPTTNSVDTTSITGYTWLSGSQKFSDVALVDNIVYFLPYAQQFVIGLDISTDPLTVIDIDTKIDDNAQKSVSAAVSPSGRIYMVPYNLTYVVEIDTVTKEVEKLPGSYNAGDEEFATVTTARNGKLYAFGWDRSDVLEMDPYAITVNVYNRGGVNGSTSNPQWLTSSRIPSAFRLRPFAMADSTSVLFHTGNTFSIFNSNNATTDTVVVQGPTVQNGVAVHFPEENDTVYSVFGNVLTEISPFEGGIAGVRSFSGNADLSVSVLGQDLQFEVGNASIGVQTLFTALFQDGAPGVYSAFGSNTSDAVSLFIRDVGVDSTSYTWDGQVGNTFSVGRIEGTLEETFNAPGFVRGFNGMISEVVAFTGDQTANGPTLGENTSFYFLDSKFKVQV